MTENPYDWKRKIEERKLELLEERIEIEKSKAGVESVVEDDNFVEALEKATLGVDFNDIENTKEEKEGEDSNG